MRTNTSLLFIVLAAVGLIATTTPLEASICYVCDWHWAVGNYCKEVSEDEPGSYTGCNDGGTGCITKGDACNDGGSCSEDCDPLNKAFVPTGNTFGTDAGCSSLIDGNPSLGTETEFSVANWTAVSQA